MNTHKQVMIDLSIPIENDVRSDPDIFRPKIKYMKHDETYHQILPFFPGLTKEDLPESQAWAVEEINLSTHNGTHMDAPYHFHPTMDGGERAISIDEVPLEWCLQAGVKLDFRHFEDGYVVTAQDIADELKRINYTLKPLDIVVMNTAAGKAYGSDQYVETGCGIGREATLYLLERGVKVVGTDAWSWDAPFVYTAKRFQENHDPSIIWEGHKAGLEKQYFQMEKLHNLESLPAFGFMISCFPIKIKNASAGWIRAVAILNQ